MHKQTDAARKQSKLVASEFANRRDNLSHPGGLTSVWHGSESTQLFLLDRIGSVAYQPFCRFHEIFVSHSPGPKVDKQSCCIAKGQTINHITKAGLNNMDRQH
jgi:hypothetical protein